MNYSQMGKLEVYDNSSYRGSSQDAIPITAMSKVYDGTHG